jgi:hypothetical protein
MAFGTLSTLDVLASTQQSVVEFGVQQAWDSVNRTLTAYNRMIAQLSGDLWVTSTDTRRSYGAGSTMVMEELDQFGAPGAQKISVGQTLDFPLRRYGAAIQFTRQAFESMTTAQLAAHVTAMMSADQANVIRAAKQALYVSTNTTFVDYLGIPAGVSLAIKALVNNDGVVPPVGPNGEVFAGTHTHYTAEATLSAAGYLSSIRTVQEHYNTGVPVTVINQSDEADFRALTGFVAIIDARFARGGGATTDVGRGALDMGNLYDRHIGFFDAAEVWVKPWAVANYALTYMRGIAPLVMRQPVYAPAGALRLVNENDGHPLLARQYERQFGMGVWNRTAAAVHDFGNASYTNPTIT